jgi:hypothetical protein
MTPPHRDNLNDLAPPKSRFEGRTCSRSAKIFQNISEHDLLRGRTQLPAMLWGRPKANQPTVGSASTSVTIPTASPSDDDGHVPGSPGADRDHQPPPLTDRDRVAVVSWSSRTRDRARMSRWGTPTEPLLPSQRTGANCDRGVTTEPQVGRGAGPTSEPECTIGSVRPGQ